MPLWCWHQTMSGFALHCASWWMSWATGSPCWSGGMYSLWKPWPSCCHVAPASMVPITPPQETPMTTRLASVGSTSTLEIPGISPPATPNQRLRSGIDQSGSLSCQLSPPSSDRNRPPGMVPAQMRPSTPPGVRFQMRPTVQGCGSSSASSGFGGNAGTWTSCQSPSPTRRQRCAPKWPRSSAANTVSPLANTAETGSPRNCVPTISQPAPLRANSNNPLRVPT